MHPIYYFRFLKRILATSSEKQKAISRFWEIGSGADCTCLLVYNQSSIFFIAWNIFKFIVHYQRAEAVEQRFYDFLYKTGVVAIFGPGTSVAKSACQIMELLLDTEE